MEVKWFGSYLDKNPSGGIYHCYGTGARIGVRVQETMTIHAEKSGVSCNVHNFMVF
jgi:hypothetical protein